VVCRDAHRSKLSNYVVLIFAGLVQPAIDESYMTLLSAAGKYRLGARPGCG
jgi:hypothetical protein